MNIDGTWELTKGFRFEAAHSLKGTTLGAGSEEIHGHSFRAEVVVRGKPDPETGMMVDLGRAAGKLTRVTVYRDSCNEACSDLGPQ